MRSSGKWSALLQQWSKDLQLWLYITATLQLFRLLLIATYHQQAGAHSGAGTVLSVLANGLRYDISTAGVWIAPTVLLSLLFVPLGFARLGKTLRKISAVAYAITAVLIFTIDLIFFGIFGDQFNQIIFGIYFDDTGAILTTFWKEYHPLLYLAVMIPVMLVNIWLLNRWLAYDIPLLPRLAAGINRHHHQITVSLIVILLVTLTIRGGKLWGEPIRLKHAFVVNDLFLNRTVINPFSALHFAIKAKLELGTPSDTPPFWPDGNIREALNFERRMRAQPAWNNNNLDMALTVTARGHDNSKPRHIFLILMESHSGWTVMPQFRNAGLSPNLSGIADEGIYFPNFIPAGSGTIGALITLLTGMPDIDMNVNYAPTASKPFPSSLAAIMKNLGYKTRFFYGGYLSWQRLDIFARSQGFEEVYGGGDMNAGHNANEWGVNDKYLFDFVLNTVDDATPSFNFILTTSNHPPYDLDLKSLGYPVKSLPEPLHATKSDTIKVMGHLWYADQQAGRFVRAAEGALHRSLFAITGDHTAREQIKFPDDNVVEQVAVPFILYGPQVLHQSGVIKRTAGAHIDVPATLIELAADQGYAYTAYGESLFHKSSPSYGYGWQNIIGENFIANVMDVTMIYGLAMQSPPRGRIDLSSELTRYHALRALSWYRFMKGARLPAIDRNIAASH